MSAECVGRLVGSVGPLGLQEKACLPCVVARQPPQGLSKESTGVRAWVQAFALTKLDFSGPSVRVSLPCRVVGAV